MIRSRRLTRSVKNRLSFESLERREMLDAALVGGILSVLGTAGDDRIAITQALQTQLPGTETSILNVAINGVAQGSFPTGTVRGIRVEAGAGQDIVQLEGVSVQSTLLGGDGDDALVGGSSRNFIYGGPGNDTLTGGAADDVLAGDGTGGDGNTSRDVLDGLSGNNLLFGNSRSVLNNGRTQALPTTLGSAAAYAQYLRDQALQMYGGIFGQPTYWPIPVDGGIRGPVLFTDTFAATSAPGVNTTLTRTNVQVAGVDEADRVEADSGFLYVISQQQLSILARAQDGSLTRVSNTNLEGGPRGMYLEGNRLTVVSDVYEPGNGSGVGHSLVKVQVFDITDRAAPRGTKAVYLEGNLMTSRVVGSALHMALQANGSYLPFPNVVDQTRYETQEEYLARVTGHELELAPLPQIFLRPGGIGTPLVAAGPLVDPLTLLRPVGTNGGSLLSLATINLTTDSNDLPRSTSVMAGYGSTAYVTANHFDIIVPDWNQTGQDGSSIYQFSLTGTVPTLEAIGSVPGQVLNSFSVDEKDGYLRLATTTGWFRDVTNSVYTLRNEGGVFTITGSIEGITPGERIFSARFEGDEGYLVTFEQVDPLITLDLSNPTDPRIRGELIIPGFSTYLQKLDATHLLGVGRTGDRKLKIALFDISNSESPRQLDEEVISPEGWNFWWGQGSEAEYDHHALSWDPNTRTLTLPVYGTYWLQIQDSWFIPPVETISQLWVFDVSDTSLTVRGKVAHDSEVRRAVQGDGFVYSIAEDSVKSQSLADLNTPISEVRLSDAPREIAPTPPECVVGVPFDQTLLHFTLEDGSNLEAMVSWGDGTLSEGEVVSLGGDRYAIKGSHTYETPGEYSVYATLQRGDNALAPQAPLNSGVRVADNLSTRPEGQWLTRIYQDTLGRTADFSGMSYWSNQLNQGMSREDVAALIADSPEHLARQIHAAYGRLLNRTADDSGLAYWSDYLRNDHTVNDLETQLLRSHEYRQRVGTDAESFVRGVYQDVLGREADAEGLAYWKSIMNRTVAIPGLDLHGMVVDGITRTEEALGRRVDGVYSSLLHRQADAEGRSYWINQLRAGISESDLMLHFTSSDEYYNRT